ncbi:AAEL014351-PA, partial [Aedes aegypti]
QLQRDSLRVHIPVLTVHRNRRDRNLDLQILRCIADPETVLYAAIQMLHRKHFSFDRST